MKIKTSELSGSALDWAVTKAVGFDVSIEPGETWRCWGWATDWVLGGPIIEREKMGVVTSTDDANVWIGSIFEPDYKFNRTGHTPLIAAMRCYVASKLGDEVDVPDELIQGESK